MTSHSGIVLVYGATGQQGEPVARRLLEAGSRVRVFTRYPGRAESLNEAGAEVAVGDFGDPASLEAASEGVDAVYFYLPLVFDVDVATAYARNIVDAAKAADVGLVVFNTGFPVPSSSTDVAALEIKREAQAYLKNSGVPNVVIRPKLYMEVLALPYSPPLIVHQGVLTYVLPNDVKVSWISHEDLGGLAVEALSRPELAGSVLEVGGPETLNGDEMAERLASVVGRPVDYYPASFEQFEQGINATLGEPIGTEVARQMRYYSENPDLLSVPDRQPALEKLPVSLTTLDQWARTVPWDSLAGPAPSEEAEAEEVEEPR